MNFGDVWYLLGLWKFRNKRVRLKSDSLDERLQNNNITAVRCRISLVNVMVFANDDGLLVFCFFVRCRMFL